MEIPSYKLNNNKAIPGIGFGLWRMKNEEECVQAVKWALESGYTHFDTAQIYGNEKYLGRALQEAGVDRSKLFVTTKLWNANQYWDDVVPSFEESLENLQRTHFISPPAANR